MLCVGKREGEKKRERERERGGGGRERERECVCVCDRQRENEGGRDGGSSQVTVKDPVEFGAPVAIPKLSQ